METHNIHDKPCPICGREKAIHPEVITDKQGRKRQATRDVCPRCYYLGQEIQKLIDDVLDEKLDPKSPEGLETIKAVWDKQPLIDFRLRGDDYYPKSLGLPDNPFDALLDLYWLKQFINNKDIARANNKQYMQLLRHHEAQYTDQEGMYKYDGDLKAPANYIDIEILQDDYNEPSKVDGVTLADMQDVMGSPDKRWDTDSPTSDILFCHATDNPAANFRSLTTSIMGVSPEKAPGYRAVLHMEFIYTQAEIAELLEITQQAVSYRYKKMLEIMRRELNQNR